MRIYLDIETSATSRQDIRDRVVADVRPPANYKSADALMKWEVEKGAPEREEAIARTALNGTWGELLVIGFAVEDRPPIVLPREDTEHDLLDDWCDVLEAEVKSVPTGSRANWDLRATWIGHNVESFDLRFLWQRSRILGVKLPFLIPLDRYPKGPLRFDTMTEWAGYGGRIKQADLELSFGLTRTDPLANGGADVHKAFAEGRLDDVVAHCHEDVRLLREIHKRMVA